MACNASSSVTPARLATFPGAAKAQKPSSSMEAMSVIHTSRVPAGSNQIEESRMLVNNLLYISPFPPTWVVHLRRRRGLDSALLRTA